MKPSPERQDTSDETVAETSLIQTQGADPETEDSVEAKPGQSAFSPPNDVLSRMPKEIRQTVEFFGAQMMGSVQRRNPLVDKLQPEHITKLIESADRESRYAFDDAQRNRWFGLAILIFGLAFMAFLVFYLSSGNPDLLEKVLALVAGFVGGFGGGYAYGLRRPAKQ
jgi:Fe2+ transport system protein B